MLFFFLHEMDFLCQSELQEHGARSWVEMECHVVEVFMGGVCRETIRFSGGAKIEKI